MVMQYLEQKVDYKLHCIMIAQSDYAKYAFIYMKIGEKNCGKFTGIK